MTLATYNEYTDTIRKEPENYCLITWDADSANGVKFDLDAATIPYQIYVKQAYNSWLETKSKDKSLLAEMVSKSIEENYKAFLNYPEYTSSDVYNALKVIKVPNKCELKSDYEDYNLELWEAMKTKDENIIKDVRKNMDNLVSKIFNLYQSTGK